MLVPEREVKPAGPGSKAGPVLPDVRVVELSQVPTSGDLSGVT